MYRRAIAWPKLFQAVKAIVRANLVSDDVRSIIKGWWKDPSLPTALMGFAVSVVGACSWYRPICFCIYLFSTAHSQDDSYEYCHFMRENLLNTLRPQHIRANALSNATARRTDKFSSI